LKADRRKERGGEQHCEKTGKPEGGYTLKGERERKGEKKERDPGAVISTSSRRAASPMPGRDEAKLFNSKGKRREGSRRDECSKPTRSLIA